MENDSPVSVPYSLVVHVGAHLGQEVYFYNQLCPRRLIWIEADPETFTRLKLNIEESLRIYPSAIQHLLVNACIGAKSGEVTDFYRYSNDGQSSSRFEPSPALERAWPELRVVGQPIRLLTRSLSDVFKELKLDASDFANALLVLDLQGGEYEALVGLGDDLNNFKRVEIEVSKEEIYRGQKTFGHIDELFNRSGFRLASSDYGLVPWHGDVAYIRDDFAIQINPHQTKIANALFTLREIERNSGLKSSLGGFLFYVSQNLRRSSAQLFQDLLAMFLFQEKVGGFFVEFGAANGELLSNTLLLERQFGWAGILAEPARGYHHDLQKNRSCAIDLRCVYSESGMQLEFIEAVEKELSSLKSFHANDHHHEKRLLGTHYQVETISLLDLLRNYDAPSYIDFISIDTEGSELSILSAFDFESFRFGLICVEHNFTPLRPSIYSLLRKNGYIRIFPEISGFDDWYVDPLRTTLSV